MLSQPNLRLGAYRNLSRQCADSPEPSRTRPWSIRFHLEALLPGKESPGWVRAHRLCRRASRAPAEGCAFPHVKASLASDQFCFRSSNDRLFRPVGIHCPTDLNARSLTDPPPCFRRRHRTRPSISSGVFDNGFPTHGVLNHRVLNHRVRTHGAVTHGVLNHEAVNHGVLNHDAVNHGAVTCPSSYDSPGPAGIYPGRLPRAAGGTVPRDGSSPAVQPPGIGCRAGNTRRSSHPGLGPSG